MTSGLFLVLPHPAVHPFPGVRRIFWPVFAVLVFAEVEGVILQERRGPGVGRPKNGGYAQVDRGDKGLSIMRDDQVDRAFERSLDILEGQTAATDGLVQGNLHFIESVFQESKTSSVVSMASTEESSGAITVRI